MESLGEDSRSTLVEQRVSQELWDSTLLHNVQNHSCDTAVGYLPLI